MFKDTEKFQIIFEKAGDGILAADIKTKRFIFANPKICEITGYSENELLKMGVEDIHPKKDLPYILEQFQKQIEGTVVIIKNIPVLKKDRAISYCDISAWPAKVGNQKLLFGFFRDITARKQIEESLKNAKIAARNVLEDLQFEKEALANANAKDEALLQSIGEGVVAIDKDGKIILMNHMAEQILSLNAEKMIGKSLYEAWKMLDEKGNPVPESMRPVIAALRGKTTTTTTTTTNTGPSYFYVRKNGTVFPVSITVTPVIVNNKIIGAIDIFHDITKEKEAEKLKTDFLSLASHQLRTPLSGTKWLIETMRREILGTLNKKQKEYIDQIYQLNERMIHLVFEMLSILRLEGGIESVKKETVLIPILCKDILISMTAAAKSMGIVLYSNLKNHKDFAIRTDQEILKNILECFVSNAINYSRDRQKVILGAEEQSDAVVFFVKDSGIGIPEKEQKKIFERFYRASNAKDLKPTGSGLGLNIAKMLAGKIGAEISFESEENKGSTFYLRVPKRSNKE